MSRSAIEILNEFIGFSIETEETEEEVDMKRVCKALEDERKVGREEGRETERKTIAFEVGSEQLRFNKRIQEKLLKDCFFFSNPLY